MPAFVGRIDLSGCAALTVHHEIQTGLVGFEIQTELVRYEIQTGMVGYRYLNVVCSSAHCRQLLKVEVGRF